MSFLVVQLYLIEILHQTTTITSMMNILILLYLIEILHQTTTAAIRTPPLPCCILSKFYIKPQLRLYSQQLSLVVSYRNSTSNHNGLTPTVTTPFVVSYRNSTSNHNTTRKLISRTSVVSYRNSTSNHNGDNSLHVQQFVVSYRNSTSNHNIGERDAVGAALYLIEILHQTTTSPRT